MKDRELRREAHAYLAGMCRNLESPSLIVGGVEDHVHILCFMSRTRTIAELIRDLKKESTKWLKKKEGGPSDFRWQEGYGTFSISPSHVDALRRYIENQEAHHRRETFKEEYCRLLEKYGIEYDERYVWD